MLLRSFKTLLICTLVSSFVGISSVYSSSSKATPQLPKVPDNYSRIYWPEHLVSDELIEADNTPDDNHVTDAGALLGRVLFYEKALSANSTISCASCHQQENGFSDPAVLSKGFEGELTTRHSMGLVNVRFYERGQFFWDERAETLEEQVLQPIQDDKEMGLSLKEAVNRVSSLSYYPDLFKNAFGDSGVTSDRIARSLAQFIRSMVSTRSRYDLAEANDFEEFTHQERHGFRLFNTRARCATCHEGPHFMGNRANNNGLKSSMKDGGVGAATGRNRQWGTFKMPSLRNIEATAPYMHDGSLPTLEAVVEHYNSGVVANRSLGRVLTNRDGSARRLNLSQREKEALVAFLKTLTDEHLLTDAKWSDPFVVTAE
ncbi:MAG: cytochrome-c peroxidase [Opitutaceae bacterium]